MPDTTFCLGIGMGDSNMILKLEEVHFGVYQF